MCKRTEKSADLAASSERDAGSRAKREESKAGSAGTGRKGVQRYSYNIRCFSLELKMQNMKRRRRTCSAPVGKQAGRTAGRALALDKSTSDSERTVFDSSSSERA